MWFQAGNQFNSKSIFLYLATAFALLAILGAGNERTDYAAHICGLIMGMLLGIAIVPLIKIFRLQALQFFSAFGWNYDFNFCMGIGNFVQLKKC